jgi:hypothetical protein
MKMKNWTVLTDYHATSCGTSREADTSSSKTSVDEGVEHARKQVLYSLPLNIRNERGVNAISYANLFPSQATTSSWDTYQVPTLDLQPHVSPR